MSTKHIERVCPGCGDKKSYDRRKRYCSLECYNRVRAGAVIETLPDIEAMIDFDAAAVRFRELIGKHSKPRTPPKKHQGRDVLIAVFSDFHAPFHDEEKFARAIAEAKYHGATRAVVPGDLLDLFSFSRFAKYEHVPVRDELAAGALILQTLSENFAEVDVIPGNHDERAKKYFAKIVPAEYMFLIKWDLIKIAAADLPNVRLPKLQIDGREIGFLWRSGDLVLGHPETSSKVLMKPADTFASWLVEWRRVLGFDSVRVVGQGHTHFAGGPVMRRDGIAVFELGCMCRIPDYAFDPKLRFHPQTNAWTLFVQRDDRTDLNESRLFFL